MSLNTVWQVQNVTRAQRAGNKGQTPYLLWFTGLSGSGKSTIANAVDVALFERGYHAVLLDGDNVRHGLNRDLGFSDMDREENIRRVGEVSKLFTDAGLIVLSAFISPFSSDRQMVRNLLPVGEFIEVFMETPLETCEQRDPKGLYDRARRGEIKAFTGIDSPYEKPEHPEVRLDASVMSIEDCVRTVIDFLERRGLFSQRSTA